jgi:2-furoyl-CoA dehydrogenase FAD binding subunit
MKPAAFAYVAPTTIAETLSLLAEHGSDARIIAGGQTLAPMLNMRMVTPTLLVDINRVKDLPDFTLETGLLRTGALVRQRDVHEHAETARRLPVLRMALAHVGHYQTRTRGTLCGSIAHADPTAELPLLLLTLGGSVRLASKRRRRTVAASDYFLGSLTTAREPDEMILSVDWPTAAAISRYSFEEITVRHGHIAVLACAACAHLNDQGKVVALSLGLTGMADRPRLIDTGQFLGAAPEAAWGAAIVERAQTTLEFIDDLHASAAYRRHIAGWLIDRALAAVTGQSAKGPS